MVAPHDGLLSVLPNSKNSNSDSLLRCMVLRLPAERSRRPLGSTACKLGAQYERPERAQYDRSAFSKSIPPRHASSLAGEGSPSKLDTWLSKAHYESATEGYAPRPPSWDSHQNLT